MKNTIIFVVLIAMACTKASDPAPALSKTVTAPTSIDGKWKFTTKTIQANGNFSIVTIAGSPTIDETYGSFVINGKTYNIGKRLKMEAGSASGSFSRFWLIATDQSSQFVFEDSQVSADFTTITAKSFYYSEGSGQPSKVYDETVVISRE